MSAPTREERQLMRQRAGLRNVNNVDFGIGFGSHGSREERQLMRTRGAGQRNIGNIDFGFSFPTPGHNTRTASTTPHSNRRRTSRLSKTPAERLSIEPPTTRSTRASSFTVTEHDVKKQHSDASNPPKSIAHTHSKRRRTSGDDSSISRQSLRRRKTSGAIFSIAEESASQGQDPVRNASSGYSAPESPLFFRDDVDKENENSTPTSDLKTKQQLSEKRASSQNMTRRRTRSSLNVLENSIAPSIEDGEELTNTIDRPELFGGVVSSEGPHAISSSRDRSTVSQPTGSKAIKKRRKRKTVVLGRKKRRSSGNDSVQSALPAHEEVEDETPLINNREDSTILRIDEDEESRNTLLSPEQSLVQDALDQRHRQSRLSVATVPESQYSEDEEGDGPYIDEEHTPEPTTPASRRKEIRKRKASGDERPAVHKKRKGRSGSSFPILTHRMANFHALPTISEERASEQRSDDESQPVPELFKDRAVPNAVDVLAQICRETIEGAIEQLKFPSNSHRPRGEVAGKRAALQAFGKELDQRLFDMSEAVEYRLSLEARLRKSKREKADLQAQWINVRRQRGELGLRADAIRRQNWENEEKAKRQWEASRLAQRIELNLETESSEASLEFRLRSIGGNVSSAGSSCGFLDKVKSFNAQLERVAAVLEGK